MKRLGMVVRADNGGLGNLTWEFFRHLKPEKALIVHASHKTRGLAEPARYRNGYTELRATLANPTPADARWLCGDIDVIYSAETWYGPAVPHAAAPRGIRLVLQANPEMLDRRDVADVWISHTEWRLDVLPPQTKMLRMPVARDLLPSRPLEDVDYLCHVHSDAMCDRNGTDLLLEALNHLRKPVVLTILGGKKHNQRVAGSWVQWLGHDQRPYYECWDQMKGIFVLPRRFGGLCLPIQEAASLGKPIVSLNLEPQNLWRVQMGLVPAQLLGIERMKGGEFPIHGCDPRRLGREIDTARAWAADMHDSSIRWADSLAWDLLLSQYTALMR